MNKIYYPCHSAIFSCCSIVKLIVYNMIILEKLTILQLVPKEFKKKLIEGENTSCKHLGTIKMFLASKCKATINSQELQHIYHHVVTQMLLEKMQLHKYSTAQKMPPFQQMDTDTQGPILSIPQNEVQRLTTHTYNSAI